jgi:hypothetical protein
MARRRRNSDGFRAILKMQARETEEVFVQTGERRKNKRYRIKSGIAALMLADSSLIARIVDISTSGLSLVCGQAEMKKNSLLEMDILLLDDIRRPDNDIFFPNVQCTVVAMDFFTEQTGYSQQAMTRCSVRFHREIPLHSYPLHRFARKKSTECLEKSQLG